MDLEADNWSLVWAYTNNLVLWKSIPASAFHIMKDVKVYQAMIAILKKQL